MADWTEKYRPTTLSEVRGNDSAVDDVREWAETWDDHGEAAVLHGSPGIGKTSAAHALAADMGWETVELNASDSRTADEIERFAGRAAGNQTLSGGAGGRQLIVLDEADNVHGNADRGGSRAITDLVKSARQPVLLIANNYYDMSRGMRNNTREIEFRDVSARSILPVLRDICRKEDVAFESAALQRIADANDGDLRGAVNDLQAAAEGKDRITEDDVVTSSRDGSVDLFPFIDTVLKESERAQDALHASYDVDETPDDLVGWIEENAPKVYDGGELSRAYDHLADADVWLGRVRATQEYGYWRYAGTAATAGVASARNGTKGGWTRWSRPNFYSSTGKTSEEVVRRIARAEGTSMATARRRILPFLRRLVRLCKPRELTVEMTAAYDFEESHVSFVTGSGEDTNKVASIVEDAEALRAERVEEAAGEAFAPRPAEEAVDDEQSDGDDGEAGDASDETDETGGLAAFAEGDSEESPGSATNGAADGASVDATEEADGDDADDGETDDADDGETDDDQSGLTDFM